MLALADSDSPLRGPFTLFFLLAAPGAAIGAALRGLEPFGRIVTSRSRARSSVNLLVAQGMLATALVVGARWDRGRDRDQHARFSCRFWYGDRGARTDEKTDI